MNRLLIVALLLVAGCRDGEVVVGSDSTGAWTTEAGLPESLSPAGPHEHLGKVFHMTTGLLIRAVADDGPIHFSDSSSPEVSEYSYEIAFKLSIDPDILAEHIAHYHSPWWEQAISHRTFEGVSREFGSYRFESEGADEFVFELPGDRQAQLLLDRKNRTCLYSYSAM